MSATAMAILALGSMAAASEVMVLRVSPAVALPTPAAPVRVRSNDAPRSLPSSRAEVSMP